MSSKPGKDFEEDFAKSFLDLQEEVSIDRLQDNMSGFKSVNTICDFIVYANPCQYYFELKSYKGRTVPIKAFRQNQLDGMEQKAKIDGVVPGFILNYRLAADDQQAYFMHIQDIFNFIRLGRKSISIDDCMEYGVLMKGNRKRTRYTYNINEFLDELMDQYTEE